jgi:hypothetical protein
VCVFGLPLTMTIDDFKLSLKHLSYKLLSKRGDETRNTRSAPSLRATHDLPLLADQSYHQGPGQDPLPECVPVTVAVSGRSTLLLPICSCSICLGRSYFGSTPRGPKKSSAVARSKSISHTTQTKNPDFGKPDGEGRRMSTRSGPILARFESITPACHVRPLGFSSISLDWTRSLLAR